MSNIKFLCKDLAVSNNTASNIYLGTNGQQINLTVNLPTTPILTNNIDDIPMAREDNLKTCELFVDCTNWSNLRNVRIFSYASLKLDGQNTTNIISANDNLLVSSLIDNNLLLANIGTADSPIRAMCSFTLSSIKYESQFKNIGLFIPKDTALSNVSIGFVYYNV